MSTDPESVNAQRRIWLHCYLGLYGCNTQADNAMRCWLILLNETFWTL